MSLPTTLPRTLPTSSTGGGGGSVDTQVSHITLISSPTLPSATLSIAGVTTTPPIVVPPSLPAVSHVISSPAGVAYPQLSEWQAEERAPGGFMAATARLAASEIHAAPHLFTAGATWTMRAHGEVIWQGILLDPITDGATARLTGRGNGQAAARDVQRILYLSRDYTDWVEGDGEPYEYFTSATWDVSSQAGRLLIIGRRGEDSPTGARGRAVLVFHADGAVITSMAFTINWNGEGSTNNVLRISKADFPQARVQQGADITLADGTDIDRAITTGDIDLVTIEVQRVEGPTTFANTIKVYLTDVRVRGAATEDEMSSSELAADVFGRLGVTATAIESTADDAMPLDAKGGTLADILDHASLVSGIPWLITATSAGRPLGVFRPPTTWTTWVGDGATNLLPVQRYNRVVVRYKATNGKARQATAIPSDIAVADPYAATGAVFTYLIDVDQAHPDAEKMTALAQRLLAVLIQARYSGDLERAWLQDPSGALVYAGNVRAGDHIRVADAAGDRSVTVTVESKSTRRTGVRFSLSATSPELARLETLAVP